MRDQRGPHELSNLNGILDSFLAKQLNRLLFHDFDSTLLDTATETLYATLCAQKESRNMVLQQLVAHYNGQPHVQERLAAACVALVPNNMVMTRQGMRPFKENLERFLLDMRGVLRSR